MAFRKIINDSEGGPKYVTEQEEELVFDQAPTQGSFNPVTSDGVAKALSVGEGGAQIGDVVPPDTTAENPLVNEKDVQDTIDDAMSAISTGYIPKGTASVSAINELTDQQNGDMYVVSDSGTISDGNVTVNAGESVAWDSSNSVWYKVNNYALRQFGTDNVNNLPTAIKAFRTGDVIPVDGPSGTAKMSKDDLLLETARNALESVDDVENTADSADLANSNYFVIAGAGGAKKLPTELLESASTISISKNHADNANIHLNEYWKNNNGRIQLASATQYKAVPRIFLRAGKKYTMSTSVNALCWIGNSEDRYIGQVSSIADGRVITPIIDCYVYISFSTEIDYNYFMLVDGEVLPDEFHPYNEIFSVKIKGAELIQKEYGENKIFYVKRSGGDFTTLKEGIEAATQYNNSTLYVEKNTYDLVSEFGQDYLDSTSSDKGLILKNGIHVIFEPGSKVVFNYSGSNAFIHSQFSPFNSGIYGFTIENVIIEASNCRYCVHDERGNSSDSYVNKYFNCDMSLDNSQNPDWSSPQPIGCGLCWGFVYINNCRFNNWISFHTNAGSSTSSKAKAIVSGCHFGGGGVIVGSTGVSTEYTDIYVINNFGYVRNLDESSPPSIVNLHLYEWNNVH